MNKKFDTKTYFEDLGAWPAHSKNIGYVYGGGFIASLVLTLSAYFLAVNHIFTSSVLIGIIVLLALIQFFVQMTCFLHLGREASSRERLIVFACVTVVVFILVAGSIWIVDNLNQRMMPDSQQMEQYMQGQTGI